MIAPYFNNYKQNFAICCKTKLQCINTVINANKLPSQIGVVQENNTIAADGNKKGFLTYGPYIKLPAGKYQFDIAYISSETNTSTVGFWDVGIALPNEYKVLDSGNIVGTNNNKSHIIQTFVIPQEYNNKKIEVRNFYDGIGKLTIETLTITKIE